MKYKVWIRISLFAAIAFLVSSIVLLLIQKARERNYQEDLWYYEMCLEKKLREKEKERMYSASKSPYQNNAYYDSIRCRFDEEYKNRQFIIEDREMFLAHGDSALFNRHYISYQMEREYRSMLIEFGEKYNLNPEKIELIVNNDSIYGDPFYNKSPRVAEEESSAWWQNVEPPSEPKDTDFAKVCGVSSIISLLFSIACRFADKKEKQKNEGTKSNRNRYEGINLADINFAVPGKKESILHESKKNMNVFGFREEFNDYMTTIIYSNYGLVEVKNVSVSVEQEKNETESITIIKNDNIFPIETLNVGDSFEIEVECYYAKAYRYFTIKWEDEIGQHSQRNQILLSKYYNA